MTTKKGSASKGQPGRFPAGKCGSAASQASSDTGSSAQAPGQSAPPHGMTAVDPVVPVDETPSGKKDGIEVTLASRVLVKGAKRAEVDGLYVAHPGAGLNKIRFVKEFDHNYSITFRVHDGNGVYRMCYGAESLYEGASPSCQRLPTQWFINDKASRQFDRVAFLQIIDVTEFAVLRNEIGWCQAVVSELWIAVLEEIVHPHPQFWEKWERLAFERISPASEESALFRKGDLVIVTSEEHTLRTLLPQAGLAWDDRMSSMLGKTGCKVIEVREAHIVAVESHNSDPVDFPAQVLEKDFSNIAAFYSHQPIFIMLQTTFCVVLWLVFAIRDGVRDGRSWIWVEIMGGVESMWPGATSLTFNHECLDLRLQLWRFLSYQYTHVGLVHVMSNALMNVFLGYNLEKFHGTLKMTAMYEFGIFGGALCYLFADNHIPVVGMSGGCWSLVGIRVADLIMNWQQRPRRWWRLAFLSSIVISNILVELTIQPEGGVSTSNSAHVGGFVAGLVAGICIGRNLELQHWEKLVKLFAALLAAIMIIACLGSGFSWPPKNVFDNEPWCWTRQISNKTEFGTWDWVCVRCHSESCIKEWKLQRRISTVSSQMCEDRGGFRYIEP